ncbi:hypothetical protein CLF_107589 [Clonorchis sinensis]|uniref:Uncharacterized protein n=1 Tax=Clonorchis sinensis TaxID=79923 RepID=G7YGX0_CLOSI|nr:hypothetical protein CLF_107589 [Clonorchis sinensis]
MELVSVLCWLAAAVQLAALGSDSQKCTINLFTKRDTTESHLNLSFMVFYNYRLYIGPPDVSPDTTFDILQYILLSKKVDEKSSTVHNRSLHSSASPGPLGHWMAYIFNGNLVTIVLKNLQVFRTTLNFEGFSATFPLLENFADRSKTRQKRCSSCDEYAMVVRPRVGSDGGEYDGNSMCCTRPPRVSVATVFEISRYMYRRSAPLIRLLKILRQPTPGFALPLRAQQPSREKYGKLSSQRHTAVTRPPQLQVIYLKTCLAHMDEVKSRRSATTTLERGQQQIQQIGESADITNAFAIPLNVPLHDFRCFHHADFGTLSRGKAPFSAKLSVSKHKLSGYKSVDTKMKISSAQSG